MKLREFLNARNMTVEAFAKEIGRTRLSVFRYLNGSRIPNPDAMSEIVAKTDGLVTANDFYGIGASPEPEQRVA